MLLLLVLQVFPDALQSRLAALPPLPELVGGAASANQVYSGPLALRRFHHVVQVGGLEG
jgi:hypothetical protein